jgi:exonuclease SbcC
MRIKSLSVTGFRGFGTPAYFDLDADAVVILGPNGSGKTSLFDAILWGLCGKVDRVSGGDSSLVSLWSDTGRAEVSVTIGDATETLMVTRVFDGSATTVTVQVGGVVLRGPGAVARLCDALWPEAAETSDVVETMAMALTRSTYLQQDLVSEFVDADSDDKRFLVISELLGAGRVADFQTQLDRERTAWARSRKEREGELSEARSRAAVSEQRLARLVSASDVSGVADRWAVWWEAALPFTSLDTAPSIGSVGATDFMDAAMQQVRDTQRVGSRMLREASSMLQRAESVQIEVSEASMPQEEFEELERRIAAAEKSLKNAQLAASEERERQVAKKEAAEELSALASLALRHLDGPCPVCQQDHNVIDTKLHLESLLSGKPDQGIDTGAIEELSNSLAALQGRHVSHLADMRKRDAHSSEVDAVAEEVDAFLRRQNPTADQADLPKILQLQTEQERLEQRDLEIKALLAAGEDLAAAASRASEVSKRVDLEALHSRQRAEVAAMEDDVDRRNQTYQVAVDLLERLRGATTEVVKSELKRMEPILQQVFAMVDPHPALRLLTLVGRFANKKGRVHAVLEDPESGETTAMPENVLSSSQLNGLAVSILIALNLGVRNLPLQTVALDDPLQSLDDVNLLGVADLLRRLKEHRQIIISTHDRRFAELLGRKLRALDNDRPTITYTFGSWSRSGPAVEKATFEAQPARFRLVEPAA